jgi:hypothetical protein
MKIIDTDNFGDDYPDEQVIADNIKDAHLGEIMLKALKGTVGPESPRYYRLVEDDYILLPGFKP